MAESTEIWLNEIEIDLQSSGARGWEYGIGAMEINVSQEHNTHKWGSERVLY